MTYLEYSTISITFESMYDSYKISIIDTETAESKVYTAKHIDELLCEPDCGAGICMFIDGLGGLIEILASYDGIVDSVVAIAPEEAMYYCIISSGKMSRFDVDYIFNGIRDGYITVIPVDNNNHVKITMSKN